MKQERNHCKTAGITAAAWTEQEISCKDYKRRRTGYEERCTYTIRMVQRAYAGRRSRTSTKRIQVHKDTWNNHTCNVQRCHIQAAILAWNAYENIEDLEADCWVSEKEDGMNNQIENNFMYHSPKEDSRRSTRQSGVKRRNWRIWLMICVQVAGRNPLPWQNWKSRLCGRTLPLLQLKNEEIKFADLTATREVGGEPWTPPLSLAINERFRILGVCAEAKGDICS